MNRSGFTNYTFHPNLSKGIKVWMRCDSETEYLTDFSIYLGRGEAASENGLGYNVVTNLPRDIQGKNHHVFLDNYFTSVKLMEDLLAQNIYACRAVRMNRHGFPDDLKGKLGLQRGKLQQQHWKIKLLTVIIYNDGHFEVQAKLQDKSMCFGRLEINHFVSRPSGNVKKQFDYVLMLTKILLQQRHSLENKMLCYNLHNINLENKHRWNKPLAYINLHISYTELCYKEELQKNNCLYNTL